MGLRLRTERFFDVPFLQRYLRHELMHIADLLDEGFGYQYQAESGAAFIGESIVRERYRVLWDISIDSRILQSGKETISDRTQRFREFAALYRKLPVDDVTNSFEWLWNKAHFRHRELLEMAQGVHELLSRSGAGHDGKVSYLRAASASPVLPGSPCPLCRFPTYAWVADGTQFSPALQALVIKDFPNWHPEGGMCERCFEGYQVRANQPLGRPMAPSSHRLTTKEE
jgi:hypothetical protein